MGSPCMFSNCVPLILIVVDVVCLFVFFFSSTSCAQNILNLRKRQKIHVISYKLRMFLKPRLFDSPLLLISGPSATLSLSLAIIQGAFAAENMKNLPLALRAREQI